MHCQDCGKVTNMPLKGRCGACYRKSYRANNKHRSLMMRDESYQRLKKLAKKLDLSLIATMETVLLWATSKKRGSDDS